MNHGSRTFRRQHDQPLMAQVGLGMAVHNRHDLALVLYFVPTAQEQSAHQVFQQCSGTESTDAAL